MSSTPTPKPPTVEELVDVFQRMRKHNTKKNIYKTSKDLFTPFHI